MLSRRDARLLSPVELPAAISLEEEDVLDVEKLLSEGARVKEFAGLPEPRPRVCIPPQSDDARGVDARGSIR